MWRHQRGRSGTVGLGGEQGMAMRLRLLQSPAAAVVGTLATCAATEGAPDSSLAPPPKPPTAPELRSRILAAAAAMRERTDWEARRLNQLFREVDEETAATRAAAVEAETAALKRALADERLAVAGLRDAAFADAVAAARAEARAGLEMAFGAQEAALREASAAAVAEAAAAAQGAADARAAEDAAVRAAARAGGPERAALAAGLEAALAGSVSQIAVKMDQDAAQQRAHRAALAGLAVAGRLAASAAAVDGAAASAAFAGVDGGAVVAAALGGAPPGGAPSLDELRARFASAVEVPTRTWLLVPDGQDGVLGHALASLMARAGLYTSEAADAGLAALNAAAVSLAGGDLAAAVAALEAARASRPAAAPAPPDDWLAAARGRLAADQAAAVVRAKVALVQVSPAKVN